MYERFSVSWVYYVNVELRDGIVRRVWFDSRPVREIVRSPIAEQLREDMREYVRGCNVDFSRYTPDLSGLSEFCVRVLREVRRIPYGKTMTYGDLARRLGTSPRAIGQALRKNPTPIIIPCHRVVGARGVGGFSEGVRVKVDLLKLEGVKL